MTTKPESQAMDESNLIGPKAAAAIFGVSPLTVARWGRAGIVPTVLMPNGRRLFSRSWCQDYMASQAVPEDV